MVWEGLSYAPRGIVPKFPVECPPYVYIAWERRFEVFIVNQGLGYTIFPDAPQIAVINCVDDAYLFGHFSEALVTEHRRVGGYICEATAGAPFENRLYECHSVSDALRTMREWASPLQPAERYLLVAELEGVQFMGDEDPNFFLTAFPVSWQRCVLSASKKVHKKLFTSFSASSRNVTIL